MVIKMKKIDFNTTYKTVVIKNTTELKKHIKPLYIIDDYIHDKYVYIDFKEKLFSYLSGCIEHKSCRDYKISFKFYKTDTKVHKLRFTNFMYNVFIWYAFTELATIDKVMNDTFIFNGETPEEAAKINNFLNDKILRLLQYYNIKSDTINRTIADIYYDLQSKLNKFALLLNIQFSIRDVINMYRSSDRLAELMATEFPENVQPAEIEFELSKIQKEVISIIKSMDNGLSLLLKSGNCIKEKQLIEFFVSQGLKPTITGDTIPLALNNSNITGGANKPSYHYIDASAARKSLIQNKDVMGKAGYFAKIIWLITRTVGLSNEVHDCRTRHLLKIDITDKNVLSKFNNRYYNLDGNPDTPLLTLDAKKDNSLIGKTLYFRSPVTCCCSNDEICDVCFGKTAILNTDISSGVCEYEAGEIGHPLQQMILSTKHLLTTITNMIKFNDNFYKFFDMVADSIYLNENSEYNLKDWAIYLPDNEIIKNDELDDMSSFNSYIDTKFIIHNIITGEELEIASMDDLDIYLTEEVIGLRKNDYIYLKDIDSDSEIFTLIFTNNELTKPLYDIMKLLNTNKVISTGITYHDMVQIFVDLLIKSGINVMSIACEVIINRLMRRDPDKKFIRPDFSHKEEPAYKLITMNHALEHNKSFFIGQSFSYIEKQLLSDETVTVKTSTSYIDNYFKEDIDVDVIHKIHDKLRNDKLKKESK